jgi:hypothetical protein
MSKDECIKMYRYKENEMKELKLGRRNNKCRILYFAGKILKILMLSAFPGETSSIGP